MRGGFFRSICFLAFLLSCGINGQNAFNQNQHPNAEDKLTKIDTDQPISKSAQIQAAPLQDNPQTLTKTDVQDDFESRSSAVAVANAGNVNPGLRNSIYNPLSPSSQASSARAIANSGGYGNGMSPFYPGDGHSSASARAVANAGGSQGGSYGNLGWKSGEPDSTSEENDGKAVRDKDGDQKGSIFGQLTSESLTKAEPSDDLISLKTASDLEDDIEGTLTGRKNFGVGSFAGTVSRVVLQNEYILPHSLPGGDSVVVCSAENQLLNVWSPVYGCMLCACVREGWYLKPVCISCSSCQQPQEEIIIPPPPPPVPEPQVSCAPLPTDVPFQNPLNPCQICICKRAFNVFGQPDVQIRCEENSQCVTPPDIDVIPPIPVPPQPVPTELCDRLPLNVPFPHPSERCQTCKCILDLSPYSGRPEKQIICVPNPECDEILPIPIPHPEPAPIPIPPIRPDDIEPIPWPPIVPTPPMPPSPLPGPPPHESCRPYPPNQPFQHPWDECQICVCSETYSRNIINIEVNCFTKRSCCNEPPIPEPLPLPSPYPPNPSQIIIDQICEFRTLDVKFSHPRDACKICTCELYGNMIIPVCRRSNEPGCNFVPGNLPSINIIYIEPRCRYRNPYDTFNINCQLCTCQEVFHYVLAKCKPQPNCGLPYYSQTVPGGSSDASAQSFAQTNALGSQSYADASALANAQLQSLAQTNYPIQFQPSQLGPSLGSASSLANAQLQGLPQTNYPIQFQPSQLGPSSASASSLANTELQGLPQTNLPLSFQPGQLGQSLAPSSLLGNAQLQGLPQTNYLLPFQPSQLGQSSASAIAQANAGLSQSSANADASATYTPGQLYYGPSGSAEASANAQSANFNPYSPESHSTAQALAEANAQSSSLYNNYNPGIWQTSGFNLNALPSFPGQDFQFGSQPLLEIPNSQTSAQAEAIANSASSLQSPFSIYPYSSVPGHIQSSKLYNTNLGLPIQYPYNPSLFGDGQGNSQGNAQAETNADGQGNAQAQANAQAHGGFSNAQAEASANVQSNLYKTYGSYPYSTNRGSGFVTSNQYPSLYTLQNNYTPDLNQPDLQIWDSSTLLQPQQLPQSQGIDFSQALAQSLAQASADAQNLSPFSAVPARPLIKSDPAADDEYSNSSEE